MARASASGVIDSSFFASQDKPTTLKLIFTTSLLDVQYLKDSVKKKLASLLVVLLGKAVGGIPTS